jgi:hypothetical protein
VITERVIKPHLSNTYNFGIINTNIIAKTGTTTTPSDSLLPLLFCIALIPLTHELKRSKCGYQVYGTERKTNHLLYSNDLKLIGRSEEELRNLIEIVKTFSDDKKKKLDLKNVAEFL